jgi:hypothetical protein
MRLTMTRANPASSSGPTCSPRTRPPQTIPNIGTTKVELLAAVADVRPEIRKNTGQAMAVETMPIVTREAVAAGDGIGGRPVTRAIGSRIRAAATSWPVAMSSGATAPSRRRTSVPATA